MKLIKICITFILSIAFNSNFHTVHYTMTSHKLSHPIRLALITDLHSCKYGNTLIDAIKKEQPDILLLGGDIFDDQISDKNTVHFLEGITTKYPTYYVTGNHEYWSGRVDEMKSILKSFHVEVLEGKTKQIRLHSQIISIRGIDDQCSHNYKKQLNQLHTNNNYFSLLLAHRPSYIKDYLKYDYDLILSGHAHGGQWRIPYILNGLFAPDEGLFPRFAGGIYQFPHTTFIVSRGLAKESTRVPRIFNRPELVIVDIKTSLANHSS